MSGRQILDEVMSQGGPGAPQELCFCELMCHNCSLSCCCGGFTLLLGCEEEEEVPFCM